MNIDPRVEVGKLVRAIPSAVPILQGYGVSLDKVGSRPLAEVLAAAHVGLPEFVKALSAVDWQTEVGSSPIQPDDPDENPS